MIWIYVGERQNSFVWSTLYEMLNKPADRNAEVEVLRQIA